MKMHRGLVLMVAVATMLLALKCEGYIRKTFNEVGLLTRDGSVMIDAINLIRCIAYNNVTINSTVSVSGLKELLVTWLDDDAGRSNFDAAVLECYQILGFLLQFTVRTLGNNTINTYAGKRVNDFTTILNYSEFENVHRNQPSHYRRSGPDWNN